MVNSDKQQPMNGRRTDDVDRPDQISDGDGLVNVSHSGGETPASANQSVTRRLREIFVEDGDGDLLLQRSDREDGVLQWLRALDMQVMGACRADERLKPMLKLNVSTGVAEDRLLDHLSQHFEPSEVGMLARCLCVPLVSIRVGKISKQGTFLSPTSIRGDLCLTLLPTSDLRILFNGDDGYMERLATLSTEAKFTDIEIEEISEDKSGRSFLIKSSDNVVSYFWCSEKSKLLGDELLGKMKDLLVRKPTLGELTGISDSRLNCFASHLRSHLASGNQSTASVDSAEFSEVRFPQSKSSRTKKSMIYQGGLSPRPSSFKEGLQKSLSSSIRSAAREKLRRRGEDFVSCVDSLSLSSSKSTDPSILFQKDTLSELNGTLPFDALNLSVPELPLSSQAPFTPHYCYCPPVASALHYTKGNPMLPFSSTEPFSLPPLSSLLASARSSSSSFLTSKPLLNLADLPPLDFPSFLPEPLVRLSTSQQQLIPTFTPFICDSIVHIPVIEMCSSGQGYLVSASPAMTTSIPPLNPNAESVLEKGARETLNMLINGSNQQPNPQFLEVFPSSSSIYNGDSIDAITNSMSTMGLILLSDKSMGGGRDDLIEQNEKPSNSGSSGFDEGID
ncbi:hypothetical protein ACP275_06G135400 [Erythranthe tilingii]